MLLAPGVFPRIPPAVPRPAFLCFALLCLTLLCLAFVHWPLLLLCFALLCFCFCFCFCFCLAFALLLLCFCFVVCFCFAFAFITVSCKRKNKKTISSARSTERLPSLQCLGKEENKKQSLPRKKTISSAHRNKMEDCEANLVAAVSAPKGAPRNSRLALTLI